MQILQESIQTNINICYNHTISYVESSGLYGDGHAKSSQCSKTVFSFSLFPFKHFNQYSTCVHVQTDDLYNTHYRCTKSVHLNYTIHM